MSTFLRFNLLRTSVLWSKSLSLFWGGVKVDCFWKRFSESFACNMELQIQANVENEVNNEKNIYFGIATTRTFCKFKKKWFQPQATQQK